MPLQSYSRSSGDNPFESGEPISGSKSGKPHLEWLQVTLEDEVDLCQNAADISQQFRNITALDGDLSVSWEDVKSELFDERLEELYKSLLRLTSKPVELTGSSPIESRSQSPVGDLNDTGDKYEFVDLHFSAFFSAQISSSPPQEALLEDTLVQPGTLSAYSDIQNSNSLHQDSSPARATAPQTSNSSYQPSSHTDTLSASSQASDSTYQPSSQTETVTSQASSKLAKREVLVQKAAWAFLNHIRNFLKTNLDILGATKIMLR